nr:glycosyl hydrolase [Tanacetum cinerariifolium]
MLTISGSATATTTFRPRMSKSTGYHKWGSHSTDFWCCYGTGKDHSLYIIQYISRMLNWKLGQISVNQKVMPVVSRDPRLRVTTTISSKKNHMLKLRAGQEGLEVRMTDDDIMDKVLGTSRGFRLLPYALTPPPPSASQVASTSGGGGSGEWHWWMAVVVRVIVEI